MKSLRSYQLYATIPGHFGVVFLLAGGALNWLILVFIGGALVGVSLLAIIALWFIMWRRGER